MCVSVNVKVSIIYPLDDVCDAQSVWNLKNIASTTLISLQMCNNLSALEHVSEPAVLRDQRDK